MGDESQRHDERLQVLVEASATLASSLDYERTLENVARILVPRMADWCVIRMRDPYGADGRFSVKIVAADPRRRALLRELARRYPPDRVRNPKSPAHLALSSARTYVMQDVPAGWAETVASDARHQRIIEQLDPRSFIVVPMRLRGRTLGAITLAQSHSGRRFSDEDVALAEELSRRAAQAIEHARVLAEARAALRSRDDLLAAVSHDLRNPLAAIKGQAQLLERQLTRPQPPTPEALVPRAQSIVVSAESMTRLIDELVDMARLRLGQRLELDLVDVDLVPLARGAVALAQAATHDHDVQLEAPPDETVWLRADPVRLERVLGNLLSNAIKYSPAGGTIAVRIGVEPARSPRWATLQVQDWGLGVPRRELPHIFKRFRRARRTDDQRIPGAGIGLATVHQIVTQHGGSVTVESEPGAGSTFTVRLPLRGAASERERNTRSLAE